MMSDRAEAISTDIVGSADILETATPALDYRKLDMEQNPPLAARGTAQSPRCCEDPKRMNSIRESIGQVRATVIRQTLRGR